MINFFCRPFPIYPPISADILAQVGGSARGSPGAAQRNGSISDGLVRRIHGTAAGAPHGMASGAAAVADPLYDRTRPGTGSVYRGFALQAAPNPLAQSGRPSAVAHHEQQFGSHVQG